MKNKHLNLYLVFATILIVALDFFSNFNYFVRSLFKIALFVIIPLYIIYKYKIKLFNFKPNQYTKFAFYASVIAYIIILSSAYLLNKVNVFSNVATSLNDNLAINKNNYAFVFIYIVLINSLVEEFFFRYFTLLNRSKYKYILSSLLFALYHVGMLYPMFNLFIFILMIIGLFIIGYFLILINRRQSLLNSILVHMVANLAINIVGYVILFK